jgi:tyrosine decarboxylase / aspartate 1-decarboxylase
MQTKGRSKKEVLSELRKIREQDLKYESGRILCSMCTIPHPAAKIAHRLFLCSNLGDSGLFPGSLQLEKEVIRKLAALLNGKKSVGFIVSGGTEANLLALLAARNMARVTNPEVVLPESAHFSFNKVCDLLRLKAVQASLDSSYRVDPVSVERCINKNTVAVIGTAGTAELGAIDPINKLSDIALDHGIYLHVDAAFGGLVIPFLKGISCHETTFDFQLEGVKSITVDPHKMGMSTIPAGGILFRDSACLEYIKTETPYLTEEFQYTFLGTRTGASVAATWAAFESLGIEGFQKTVKHCIELTAVLSSGLESRGFQLVSHPTLNIVAFRSSNSKLLAEKLRQHGWFVSYVPRLDCIRIVVMPHLRKRHIMAFLEDLCKIAENRNIYVSA